MVCEIVVKRYHIQHIMHTYRLEAHIKHTIGFITVKGEKSNACKFLCKDGRDSTKKALFYLQDKEFCVRKTNDIPFHKVRKPPRSGNNNNIPIIHRRKC